MKNLIFILALIMMIFSCADPFIELDKKEEIIYTYENSNDIIFEQEIDRDVNYEIDTLLNEFHNIQVKMDIINTDNNYFVYCSSNIKNHEKYDYYMSAYYTETKTRNDSAYLDTDENGKFNIVFQYNCNDENIKPIVRITLTKISL